LYRLKSDASISPSRPACVGALQVGVDKRDCLIFVSGHQVTVEVERRWIDAWPRQAVIAFAGCLPNRRDARFSARPVPPSMRKSGSWPFFPALIVHELEAVAKDAP
jgi:hypothetical protein